VGVGEQRGQAVLLSVGVQVSTGVQSASCRIQRVGFAATAPIDGELDLASALGRGSLPAAATTGTLNDDVKSPRSWLWA
jgi:hypothetical protein